MTDDLKTLRDHRDAALRAARERHPAGRATPAIPAAVDVCPGVTLFPERGQMGLDVNCETVWLSPDEVRALAAELTMWLWAGE